MSREKRAKRARTYEEADEVDTSLGTRGIDGRLFSVDFSRIHDMIVSGATGKSTMVLQWRRKDGSEIP